MDFIVNFRNPETNAVCEWIAYDEWRAIKMAAILIDRWNIEVSVRQKINYLPIEIPEEVPELELCLV